MEEKKIEKEKFKLFDFFANCEYFEEEYDYDQVIKLPKIGTGDGGEGPIHIDEFISHKIDPLKSIKVSEVGP